MKLSDVVRMRRNRPNPFPTARSVGAAVYEHHARRMHADIQAALQAVFDGDTTEVDDQANLTSMVRGHRDGLLRKLDGDLRFLDFADRLQKLETLRELYERDPALVALAVRGQHKESAMPSSKKECTPAENAGEDK
jgi:hypothetical protein